jgi:hypothetical protein
LTHFLSAAEPVWTKESKLKTDQKKEAIRIYQDKGQIEMEQQRQEEIQRHADIEIESY